MTLSTEDRRAIAFLKLAAIDLRRIAELAPEVAADVRRLAQQIEAETADMERRNAARPASA
jgi:hypothetical protein